MCGIGEEVKALSSVDVASSISALPPTTTTPSTPKAIDSSSIIVKAATPASPATAPRIHIQDDVDDPVEVGESLFRQIDRNNDEVVSQVELVKALRSHSDIAAVSCIGFECGNNSRSVFDCQQIFDRKMVHEMRLYACFTISTPMSLAISV